MSSTGAAEEEQAAASTDTAMTRPTFSALPLGPLATAVLFLKEDDLAQLLRTNKDMRDSALDSDDFWRERCYNMFGRHLECIEMQTLGKRAFRAFLEGGRHAKDESLWGRDDCNEHSDQLLQTALGASSQDQENEAPRHTLVQSPCAVMVDGRPDLGRTLGQRFQVACGCIMGQKCYWSSEPSAVSKDEWLEFDLMDKLAVVTSFVLTPYQSFWQPEEPTYNPIEASFQLTHPAINRGKPYYESPRFQIQPSMSDQVFELPQSILSVGGTAKILLLGMAQRQTLDAHLAVTANHYHVCISHVALKGTILCSCQLGGVSTVSTPPRLDGAVSFPAFSGADKSNEAASSTEKPSMQEVGLTQGWATSGALRLQWVVTVVVGLRQEPPPETPSMMPGLVFHVVKVGDDTSCLEVLEAYAQKLGRRSEGVRLWLVDGSGAEVVLPADGVVGDFAVRGRLNLLDMCE